MPDRESLRYAYLRRVVAPLIGALGLGGSLRLARRLAHEVRRLRSAAWRQACCRCQLALQSADADSPDDRFLTLRSAEAIIDDMYDHVARFWIEAAFIHRRLRSSSWRSCVRIDHEDELLALRRQGGCLLTTACYGNPAVAAVALGELFRPVHVVVDRFPQPVLRKWQESWYHHRWVRTIERHETALKVPDILRNGGAVLMFCDQERCAGPVIPARFLGRPFHGYPTLGRLAGWLQVPIGVVLCRRDPSRSFEFTLTPHGVVQADQIAWAESPGQETARIVREVLALVELAIMKDPAQYFWLLPTGRGFAAKAPRPRAWGAAVGKRALFRASRQDPPIRPMPDLSGDAVKAAQP